MKFTQKHAAYALALALLSACGQQRSMGFHNSSASFDPQEEKIATKNLEAPSLAELPRTMPAPQDLDLPAIQNPSPLLTVNEPKKIQPTALPAPELPIPERIEPKKEVTHEPAKEPSQEPSQEPAAPREPKRPSSPLDFSSQPKLELRRLPEFSASWGLRRDIYEKAVKHYENNIRNLPNARYVTIVDFSKRAGEKRFFVFDLDREKVVKLLTTAGLNSDPDGDGLATLFSNTENSLQTSLGLYLTLDSYVGEHGYSLRLRGLEASNSNAEKRNVVIHSAPYVKEDKNSAGRSWGCLALDPSISKSVIDRIKGGSLLYVGN